MLTITIFYYEQIVILTLYPPISERVEATFTLMKEEIPEIAI